jgi:hypothetical protein
MRNVFEQIPMLLFELVARSAFARSSGAEVIPLRHRNPAHQPAGVPGGRSARNQPPIFGRAFEVERISILGRRKGPILDRVSERRQCGALAHVAGNFEGDLSGS